MTRHLGGVTIRAMNQPPVADGPEALLRPLSGRVMIRLDPAPTQSAGTRGRAILLPESVQKAERENYRFGTVVALGDPVLHPRSGRPIPWVVSPGDRVCFQFGADLSGERELQYTKGVPHALCFAEDLLYVIEAAGELRPVYITVQSVDTALAGCTSDMSARGRRNLAKDLVRLLAGDPPK